MLVTLTEEEITSAIKQALIALVPEGHKVLNVRLTRDEDGEVIAKGIVTTIPNPNEAPHA